MDPNFFTNVLNPFALTAPHWFAPILALGTPIFWMLATLELCTVFAVMVINRDIPSMCDDLMLSLIGIAVGYVIFQNAAEWGLDLVQTIGPMGGQVGGLPPGAMNPDGVMKYGYAMASALWAAVGYGSFFVMPGTTILCLLVGVAIFALFVWIAVTLLLLLCEAFFAVIGGSIFLPFGAFRFTHQLLGAWINWIMGVGVQTFTMYLVLSIALPIINGWVAALRITAGPGSFTSAIPMTANFLNPMLVLAQAMIFWALAVKMPLIARGKVDGVISPFVGVGGVVRSAMSSIHAGADALEAPGVSDAIGSGVSAVEDTLRAMLLAT